MIETSIKDWSPRGRFPEYRIQEIRGRLEAAWNINGDMIGYLHSRECMLRGFDYDLCMHECNPDGFVDAKEAEEILRKA